MQLLHKLLKQELWEAGNNDTYTEDILVKEALNYVCEQIPEELNQEETDEAIEIYRQGFFGNELEQDPIATINTHLNAIADELTNITDKDFKTSILRQVKSIKAILRKEVLK
ncbi:MAG: hypothetical protein H6743_03935 [Rickettsiaceae bacterium]|nr:hypothetical protein [Rickettsiaceae bacterium]